MSGQQVAASPACLLASIRGSVTANPDCRTVPHHATRFIPLRPHCCSCTFSFPFFFSLTNTSSVTALWIGTRFILHPQVYLLQLLIRCLSQPVVTWFRTFVEHKPLLTVRETQLIPEKKQKNTHLNMPTFSHVPTVQKHWVHFTDSVRNSLISSLSAGVNTGI